MNNALEQARQRAIKMLETQWVKWVHESTPQKHCAFCLNLGDCCFTIDKCPELPLHPNCHCYTKAIGQIDASAFCKDDKIQYAFTPRKKNDKSKVFTNLGYSIKDSEYLIQEFINQGKQQYGCGEYELRELKIYGQTIRIVTRLRDRQTGEIVSFYTGWIVEPNGHVRLTTPFCGWVE